MGSNLPASFDLCFHGVLLPKKEKPVLPEFRIGFSCDWESRRERDLIPYGSRFFYLLELRCLLNWAVARLSRCMLMNRIPRFTVKRIRWTRLQSQQAILRSAVRHFRRTTSSPETVGYPRFGSFRAFSIVDYSAPVSPNRLCIRAGLREQSHSCQVNGRDALSFVIDLVPDVVSVNPAVSFSVGKPFKVRTVPVLCHPKPLIRLLEPAALTAPLTQISLSHRIPRKRQAGCPSRLGVGPRPGS